MTETSTTSIKDFEGAIAELESIVKKLEEGDLALEQSLALYERGVQLSRFCHAQLEQAERRIEILNERGELKPAPASLTADILAAFLEKARAQVDEQLERYLPSPPACPAIIAEAMRYSVFAGGKRLRPMLTLAAAAAVHQATGIEEDFFDHTFSRALPAACAI